MTGPQQTLKNVLILGGGGFIGSNLCRVFHERGYVLRIAGRSAPQLSASHAEFQRCELGVDTDYRNLLEGQDAVVHLLSTTNPSTSNLDLQRDVSENLLPTIALLEACRKAGTGRLVFLSSGGTVYGPQAEVPTPETAPTEPISGYGIVKLGIEKYLGMFERQDGPKSISLRVSNPFGPLQKPGKGQGVVAAFARRIMDNDPVTIFGDGSVQRDFVYVDDVVDAIEASLGYEGNERVFNIGSGIGRSIAEVLTSLEIATGKRAQVRHEPARSVDVPASILSIERAKTELDWTPRTDWARGVRLTVDWMAQEHAA